MMQVHVDDPQNAIREIYRILKTGGKMILTDLDAHEFEFLKKRIFSQIFH